MRIDWGKIESDYMASKLSYREIAQKYGVSASSVARHGTAGGWPEKREQFAGKVQTRARQKAADKKASREAEAILRVEALGERLIGELERALSDEQQLYRHVLMVGKAEQDERVLDKIDTQAVKDMATVLMGIGKMMAELGGLMTKKDAESIKIARERLRLDKRKAEREESGDKAQEVRITFGRADGQEGEGRQDDGGDDASRWEAYSG